MLIYRMKTVSDYSDPIGGRLLDLTSVAESSVVLVAPFIKAEPLKRVLDTVSPGVPVHCFTRWRPEELVSGISDIDIWPLLRDRGASLRLRYDLHAKVFCNEAYCLVGSANLTATALGWTQPSNLEMLVSVPKTDELISEFFRKLSQESEEVNDALYFAMKEVIAAYPVVRPVRHIPAAADSDSEIAAWRPRCRAPDNRNLYRTYQKRSDMVSTTTYEDAAWDLMILGVPDGIPSEDLFLRHVSTIFRLSPIVALVREEATTGILPEAGQLLITQGNRFGNGLDGEVTGYEWITMRRWLTTLLPDEFRERQTEYGPEILKSVRIA
jgi:hypothetical protein